MGTVLDWLLLYEYGHGTAKEMLKAFDWYIKSVEKGNSVAICNLGTCYDLGRGVDQDETKAFELYEQSSLLGNSAAMFNLGYMYCYGNGDGVTKDINKAKEWCAKSAAQGYEPAQTKLAKLNAPPAAESDDE